MADDLEDLKAERDALQAEVDALKQRKLRRTRGVLATVGVVLSCVLLLASALGIWARRSFLRTDIFSDRVGNLIDRPEVQTALSAYLSTQINELIDPEEVLTDALPDQADLLAVPLSGAIRGFITDRVDEFVRSDTFADLWKAAVEVAHRTAVRVLEGDTPNLVEGEDQVVINLLPVIDAVLADIGEQSPEIFGRTVDLPTVSVEDLPDEARERIGDALGITLDEDFGTFTVYDGGKLSAAQDAVELANKLVWLLVVLTPLVMAGTIALSARRRRTVLQLAGGVLLVMVLLRRLIARFQEDLLELVRINTNRPAVEVTTDAFLEPLRTGALWLAWIALIVLVVAAVTGPYPWAVRLRSWVGATSSRVTTTVSDRAHDEATAAWAQRNLDALRIAGGVVGIVLLWWLDLSWFGFLLVIGLVGAYEVALAALAARATEEPAGPVA
jgi:hypothetical protein